MVYRGFALFDLISKGNHIFGGIILIALAAEEWSSGLGRWSLMREVQSSNPHGGYTPHVSTWHGVTPPDCDQWQGW